jgi:SH3-like domain-containing protein
MLHWKVLAFASLTGLSVFASAAPATAQIVEGEEHCVVNVKTSDVLNVRAKSNVSSRVVSTLRYGECGIIVMGACKGSWCPIKDGHNAGWVNSRFISMVSPAMYCVAGVAAGDKLNLRAFPSPTSRIVTKLGRRQCDISFLPYSTGDWQKVRTGGYEGWANRTYLSGQ